MGFSVVQLQSIRINRPVIRISGRDVERVLDDMRQQQARWKPAHRESEKGDMVVFSCHAKTKKDRAASPAEYETSVVIGSNALHPGLEKELAGRKPGDTLRTVIKYKSGYPDPAVAGKRIAYSIRIHRVLGATLPRLDARFARGLGMKDGSLEKLREKILQEMRRQLDRQVKRDIREQVFGELLRLHGETPGKSGTRRVTAPEIRQHRADGSYRQRVLAEIMQEIIRHHRITLDSGKGAAAMNAIAIGVAEPGKTISGYYDDRQKLAGLNASVLEHQVIELVLKHAELRDRKISYDRYRQRTQFLELTPRIISLTPEEKCGYCARNCCTYITQRIPAPRSKTDFSFLLWQVAHKGVSAYKDNNDWFLQFDSVCEHLTPEHRCGIYNDRMQICRTYSNQNCEFEASASQTYRELFEDHGSLLAYCRKRFKTWTY